MTALDKVQLAIAVVALALQLLATFMARPLREITPRRLWLCLMTLNFFVLLRRSLSLAQVGFGWSGQHYENVAVLDGLAVSVFMVLSIHGLRKHLLKSKQDATELAAATLELAQEVKAESSAAYRLALYFIQRKENVKGEHSERGEKGPPGPVGPRGPRGAVA